jgi:hypothetical protein
MLNRNHKTWMKMYEKRLLRTIKEKVLIRDILVTQDRLDDRENRVGEFHSTLATNESEDAFAKRIMLHIKKMASIASDIHRNDNFTVTEEKETSSTTHNKTTHAMKANCINNVTRLSFNEYYFYPGKKRGPLSLHTLKEIITEIEKLASLLPENLHLVLASFPVVDLKKQVSNMVIHVQCSQTPVLHMFAKAIPSNNEPVYPDTQTIEFCTYAFNPIPLTALEQKGTAGNSINFSSPILCKTAGGATFWTTIDICADHESGIAKQALHREIALRMRNQSQNIPERITHMLISNSTFIYDANTVSATVTHVDPTYHTLHTVASDKKWEPDLIGNTNVMEVTGTSPEGRSEIRSFPQREMDTLGADLLRPVQIYNKDLAAKLAQPCGQQQTMRP